MLEIWGRPYSSNVIPVIWAAAECGVDYKLKLAGGSFGQIDTPQFAQMNPNRLIPAIRDGDFALWESHVIVRYLCAKYAAGTLYPENIQQRAVADQCHAADAEDALKVLEQHLEKHQYVAGAEFTMGDIPLGAVAYRYYNVESQRPSFPNIEAWYSRLCERPAYQKHVMRFFGTNPDEWQALEKACASEGE